MQPLIRFATDSEQEKKMTATKEALEAWGGLSSVRRMIIIAVNKWEEAGCDFRRGRSDYATAWLDYATKVPETLHVQPGLTVLNGGYDPSDLAGPHTKAVLDRDRAHVRQWAIALPGINSPDSVHDVAVPALLKAQQANSPCAFTHMLYRAGILEHGLKVGMTSAAGRRDIQMYLCQYDVQGYQVSGAPEDRTHVSNPPRTVHSNLTAHLTSSNLRPTLHLGIIFDLDYVHPVHASSATSSTAAANEVVARSSGAKPPRV